MNKPKPKINVTNQQLKGVLKNVFIKTKKAEVEESKSEIEKIIPSDLEKKADHVEPVESNILPPEPVVFHEQVEIVAPQPVNEQPQVTEKIEEKAPEKIEEPVKPAIEKRAPTPAFVPRFETRPGFTKPAPFQPSSEQKPSSASGENQGFNRSSFAPRTDGQKPYAQRLYQPRTEQPTPQPYQPRPYQAGAPGSYQPRTPYGAPRTPYQPRTDQAGNPAPYQPRTPYGAPRTPYQPRAPFGAPRAPTPPNPEEVKKSLPKPRDEEGKKPAAFKEFRDVKAVKKQDSHKSFDSRDKQGLRGDEDSSSWRRKRKSSAKESHADEDVIRPKNLKIRIPITIKDLASEMKIKASHLLSSLFMKGLTVTLNDFLEDETTIQLLGHDFDCEISIDTSEEERLKVTGKTIQEEITESGDSLLVPRPPVVTFMGHVDHGKTSLIDYIRKSNVALGEAGAITQHIGAFKCQTEHGSLTILDTPGHEAFFAMRSRGAEVTDLVVLVIAGDEGMRTQTIEAMNQAKAANVPIMIAINKCDKPNFDAENVYRQLSEHELLPEAWGGQTITVNCSAITGSGIKDLLEMIALQTEVLELKANPSTRARGTVIESEMHKGLGSVATVLVQNGTLKLGDALVFENCFGKVKTMHDEHGKEAKEAGPSSPIKITGLSDIPKAGCEFVVVKNEKEAKSLSEDRHQQRKFVALQVKKAGVENLLEQHAEKQNKKNLNLIIRADVQGSLEALKQAIQKIVSSKVEVNILSAEVGEISQSDITLASTSKAIIFGFHTKIESHAESDIKRLKVEVKLHNIIYKAVDQVKEMMTALLDKIPQENEIGEVNVKAVFKSSQHGIIAGCQVASGFINRNSFVRVVRSGTEVWKGAVASLKRGKEDVREVPKGHECGILLQGFSDFKEEDIFKVYEITYLTQEL